MERSSHLPHRSPGGDPRLYGSSPSMAPADVIRMSFDQIYRATPVNPMLAQQLRRQQQAAMQPMGTFMGPPVYASPPSSSSIHPLGVSTVHNAPPGMTNIAGASPHRFQSPPYPSEQSQQPVPYQAQPASYSSPPKPTADRSSSLPSQTLNSSSNGIAGLAPAASVVSMLPPPPVAGGSRSRRMASSSMDTLLALGGKKPITAAVPGAVPSIRPPEVPSSSSAAASRDSETSAYPSMSRSKSAPSLSVPATKPSGQSSRKSLGGRVQPPSSKAAVETAPASPPTTTRSGRVSKPVSRIVREMDNPASSTSYTVVKAVGHDAKSTEDPRERRKSFPQRSEDPPVPTNSIPKHELLGNMNRTSHQPVDPPNNGQAKKDRGETVTKKETTKVKPNRRVADEDEDEDFVEERPVTNKPSTNKVSKKKDLSVGDKLQAMIAEADKTLAAVQSRNVADDTQVVGRKSKPWSPTEVVALYAVYNKTDVTLPNCWQIISERLQKEKNILRTEEECKEKWFSALQDVKKRQERMHQKKKQNQVEAALQKLQTINEQAAEKLGMKIAETALQGDLSLAGKGHGKKRKANGSVKMSKDDPKNEDGHIDEGGSSEEDSEDDADAAAAAPAATKGKKATGNMKRPRLGKNDLKALAEHSSKATKEDDVFESASFQNHLQQQKQKKLSAVAQYLQQQQQKKAIPSPFRNEATTTSPFPSSTAMAFSSPLPTSATATQANASPPVINTLAVRKKSTSAMNTTPGGSASLLKSPGSSRSVPGSAMDVAEAASTASTDDFFDDLPTVATPTSRRGPLKAAGNTNGDDDDEDDDALFATRVVQKIKRVKPSLSSSTFPMKKRQSLGGKKPKAITSAREITKEIHQAMKKVRSTFSDSEVDEEENLQSDADDMDIDDF